MFWRVYLKLIPETVTLVVSSYVEFSIEILDRRDVETDMIVDLEISIKKKYFFGYMDDKLK